MKKHTYERLRRQDEDYDPEQIAHLYGRAYYQHATGRFRYNKEGSEIIDVLNGIIKEGVIPHPDEFTAEMGIAEAKTISLTRAKMWARAYANIFLERGKYLEYEYGKRLLWSLLFQTRIKIIDALDMSRWKEYFVMAKSAVSPKGLVSLLRGLAGISKKASRIKGFVKHATKENVSLLKSGLLWIRSDIEGNYPIILGIQKEAIVPLPGANKGYGSYETRTTTPFRLEDCSHIEVPLVRLEEVRSLLKEARITIPVIAIEDMDLHCSKIPLQEHLRPDWEGRDNYTH